MGAYIAPFLNFYRYINDEMEYDRGANNSR